MVFELGTILFLSFCQPGHSTLVVVFYANNGNGGTLQLLGDGYFVSSSTPSQPSSLGSPLFIKENFRIRLVGFGSGRQVSEVADKFRLAFHLVSVAARLNCKTTAIKIPQSIQTIFV